MKYKTVKKCAYDEFVEKKSRFIGYCCPVQTEEDALGFIGEVKAKHRDATHSVYAYIVRENNIMRYSDDGEPSGTAGMPVLDVMRNEGLCDIAVVVTRYFGGTLLGTGGLVRAYTKGAKVGIEAAEVVTKLYCNVYSISCDYPLSGKLRYAIEENESYILQNIEYSDVVEFTICVQTENAASFEKMIEDKSSGSVKPEIVDTTYIDT